MLRNDDLSTYDPGIRKGVHYAIVAVALVVGIVVGAVIGTSFKNQQIRELRFGRDLNAMSGAMFTLDLVEQSQRDRIRKVQLNLLALHARDAAAQLPALKRLPLKTPQLLTFLGRAHAYAQSQKMTETASQIAAIRQRIAAQP